MDDKLEKLKERRIIAVSDDINSSQSQRIRAELLELSLISSEEIRLLIDSNGGNTVEALFICDFISCLKAPITGIVVGRCSSMAVAVLAACNRRMALKHARFFLHFVSTSHEFSNSLSKKKVRVGFEERFLEGLRQQVKVEQFIASRIGRSVREIRKLMRNGDEIDAWLGADKALSFNLIEEIIKDPRGLLEAGWVSCKK